MMNFALLMPLPYVGLLILLATNPFNWQPTFVIWLLPLSIFQPLAFIWVYIFLSRFYAKFKALHVERIAQKIEKIYLEAADGNQKDSRNELDELKAWIEFQRQLASERTTPFTPQATLLFLTTSLPAIIQSGLLFRELLMK
jgi:hypothetical protein